MSWHSAHGARWAKVEAWDLGREMGVTRLVEGLEAGEDVEVVGRGDVRAESKALGCAAMRSEEVNQVIFRKEFLV